MKIDKTFTIKFDNDDFGYLDAFGLESEHTFEPFSNLELPDSPPLITHIVGESGSGKSQLSKILADKWNLDFPEYPADSAVCCEFIGHNKEDIDKMIYYLNYVGLSDARLYYTEYKYLSDSQKFRAILAYNFANNNSNGYVFDEFLSTLDRETAKSIACLIAKLVRKEKIKVVLTTAHDDLIDYLNPDLIIRGYAFPERFEIEPNRNTPKTIQYFTALTNKQDYKDNDLGRIHYKGKYTGGAKEHFKAFTNRNTIGYLVTAAVGKESEMKRRIARVVVHPSYRGIGVGTELVKAYLYWAANNGIKKVYAVSALGLFNPFFEKAGMDKKDNYVVKQKADFVNKLTTKGFDTNKWFSKDYCVDICKKQEIRNIVASLAKGAIRVINPGGRKMSVNEAKHMILSDASHAGRYLWTLRPRTLARYEKQL